MTKAESMKMGRRNINFQNRKKGLKKKMSQLSTLCGVDACLIIFGPDQGDQLVVPETWPEDPKVVLNVLERFKKQNTKQRRGKKQPSNHALKALLASLDSKLELVNKKIADLTKEKQNQHGEGDDVTGLIEHSDTKEKQNQHGEGDDVTGLTEYSDPLMDQSPPPPFFWDSSDASKMDDMRKHMHPHNQQVSFMNQLDNPHHVPLETTRMINDMDCNGASSRTIPCHHPTVVVPPIHYNPMLQTLDEMAALNNAGGDPLDCYFSPDMQTMLHSYFAPQLHQMNDFPRFEDGQYFAPQLHQINQFSDLQVPQTNGVACSSTLQALDDHQPWGYHMKGVFGL